MLDAEKYTYRVSWSEEDQEHVASCAEFPSLNWLEPSAEDALKGITKLVQDCIEDMRASGEVVPEPFSLREYSGRFQIRMTPEAHRRLAIQAAEKGMSLNRIAVDKLAI